MASYLRVSEIMNEEALQNDERYGDAGCVGVETVDVLVMEEKIAAAGDEEAEDEGVTQTEVVVGDGKVPEDSV